MKYTLSIFLVILLSLGPCSTIPQSSRSLDEATQYLLGEHKIKQLTWEFTSRYDPYDGGKVYDFPKGERDKLTFYANGIFKREKNDQTYKGNWYLHPKEDSIAFVNQSRDGKQIPKKKQEPFRYRHKIVLASSEKMLLIWQGRHGYVEDTYQLVNE